MNNKLRVTAAFAVLALASGCGIFKGGANKTPVLGERMPILLSENDIVADKTLEGVEVLLPEPAVNDAWRQPGGNAAKSMGHLALAAAPARAWSKEVAKPSNQRRLAAAPVISDNRLYVVDTDGVVHAMAADTGADLWRAETAKGDDNQPARFGGGVSVEGERAYATNGLGDVVALNAATGAEVWRKRPGGPLRGSPTLANGNVYVVTQDNQLFALAQETGEVSWTASASLESQGVFGVAAPASAQGTVVAGFSSGELNAYRYENGRTLWDQVLSRTSMSTSVSSLSDIDAEPVIDQGRVYAVGQGGRMVAIDIASGNPLWEQNIAGISTPWAAGEWLFVVTDDARLIALSRGSGKVRWIAQLRNFRNVKKSTGAISWSGPVLAGGKLVLGNSEGELAYVSPTDGSVLSTVKVDAPISLPLIVANSTLYVLDDKGKLTAYR
ncbi:outer membrane protein assembly factor BamB family protein [Sphingomonas sp. M1-B02]|uniref:outer membrane protein assembly factor BamB family protein n=1 Tax=Sphingomonas sp. M1-B02 TaxID=3114300 RepID=UPI002240D812|nr:PQQ-binding-like beta-propeller repeat protein [Sphingomonas sp. S6-11]UZK66135.1 PQQ-binding-like beta-propeller repeat protein [Sphingomonas sp. S6-11]